ncbi:MAG TPA: Holliday junction branch migration protein RuvA [Alphaproteobacteria bacterium]|jgi:Holliday junction DNA helicase RuvA|nr:Holliday junction branch migration protein RuvA [Alphaproteobacteria bacterium]
MIAKLKGEIDSVAADHAVIEVGGVGYLVFCPGPTLEELRPGAPATLLIETHVREDHIHLYGFSDSLERDWFRLLQTVQGVGARVALGILSALGAATLAQAIAVQDKALMTQAPGVGAKLGARIVAELKDKVPSLIEVFGSAADGAAATLTGTAAADAVSALVNLGYRRADAFSAVTAAAREAGSGAAVETLIRGSLHELAQ